MLLVAGIRHSAGSRILVVPLDCRSPGSQLALVSSAQPRRNQRRGQLIVAGTLHRYAGSGPSKQDSREGHNELVLRRNFWNLERVRKRAPAGAARGAVSPMASEDPVEAPALEPSLPLEGGDIGSPIRSGNGGLARSIEMVHPSEGGLNGAAPGSPAAAVTSSSELESNDPPEGVIREQALEAGRAGGWQRRWTIVALCFFAFLLCNMDRVNMSVAVLPMATEFQWSPATVGLIQSSFFWGYLLTQVLGGAWADTYGGKQVLGFGVVWWSVATLLTPLAASLGLPALLFARASMGIGEGVAMPAMNNLLSKWVPIEERSRSLAVVYSGMSLGSVLGLSLSPAIIQSFSWPSVFFSFGSLGIVWAFAWQRWARSSPAEDPSLDDEERQLLLAPEAAAKSAEVGDRSHSSGGGGVHLGEAPLRLAGIPWRKLLSERSVWAIIVCHFCHNWGIFILLTWMPTYYHDVFGFNLTQSGLLAVLPWLTMAIASNIAGWIGDTLISRGVDVTAVRKGMQTIGFLGPALGLTLLSHVTSPTQAILLLMASQGTDAFSQAGLYSNHQDIAPRYAGVLLGLSNSAGVLAGVLGTYATGQILQHGNWDEVFKVAVGLYLVGTVVWNLFATGERVFD